MMDAKKPFKYAQFTVLTLLVDSEVMVSWKSEVLDIPKDTKGFISSVGRSSIYHSVEHYDVTLYLENGTLFDMTISLRELEASFYIRQPVRAEVLNYLDSLDTQPIDYESQSMLIEMTQKIQDDLEQLGVPRQRVQSYVDDGVLCVLSLAVGEGFATHWHGKFIYDVIEIDLDYAGDELFRFGGGVPSINGHHVYKDTAIRRLAESLENERIWYDAARTALPSEWFKVIEAEVARRRHEASVMAPK